MMDQQEQQQQIIEPLPEFAQIEGQKVKLAGLDYTLLEQQTANDRKANLMKQIKSKLSEMAYKMPLDSKSSQAKLSFQNDQLTKNIMMSVNVRPSITQSTFYVFPTEMQFAPALPQIVTRRFGRMHTEPLYIHHSAKQVEIFKQLLIEDDKRKKMRKEQLKQAKKVIDQLQVNQDSDSDDIFAAGSDQESKQDQIVNSNAININVGSKLSFGVNEMDIFGGPRYKKIVQQTINEPKVNDKFDFLRKKVKVNEDDDGYGECYAQTGPSLQEMKQLKKQGIQLFGDAKQFTQKERKINLNRDYQKIKRIIEQKQKAA